MITKTHCCSACSGAVCAVTYPGFYTYNNVPFTGSGPAVNCGKFSLTEINCVWQSNVSLLLLRYNNITAINANAFTSLTSLQTLHVGLNPLTSVAVGAFNALANLQML